MRYRKTVIGLTVGIFVFSIFLFSAVPQQFFPPSGRLELMVDMKLEEGASLTATQAKALRLEVMLGENDMIENYVGYMGSGSPRFYLSLDQKLPAASVAQFVVLTRNVDDREQVRDWLMETLDREFPAVRTRVSRLENGPPVGYPIQLRISGEHIPRCVNWLGVSLRKCATTAHCQRAPGLGGAQQGRAVNHRSGPGAYAWHYHFRFVYRVASLGFWRGGQPVP